MYIIITALHWKSRSSKIKRSIIVFSLGILRQRYCKWTRVQKALSVWHQEMKFGVDCLLVIYSYKKMYGWIDKSNQVFYLLYIFLQYY